MVAETPAQILEQPKAETVAQEKTTAQVEISTQTDNAHDLYVFAGAGALVLFVGVLSMWVTPFQSVVANGVSTLIGAAAMYLKGK